MPARPGASLLLICVFLAIVSGLSAAQDRSSASARTIAANDKVTQGQLRIVDAKGKPGDICPLKHTDVKAEVSGFLTRVTITQEFQNPRAEKIEAIYLFPLSQRSAVDQLTMEVGGRVIRGEIRRREEAQRLFEQARTEGRVAALLNQERPNLFIQSVTNILPGAAVKVTLSYVETLPYEDGAYEFTFPMVAGHRHISGEAETGDGRQSTAGTDHVPDAERVLMTPFTSFIAVDEIVTAPGEAPQRTIVPAAAPNGMITVPAAGGNPAVTGASSAMALNAGSAEIAATIEDRRSDALPLNMRQPTEVAKLAPGAAPA